MNDKADFAPIRWSYKVTREIARRMDGTSRSRHLAIIIYLTYLIKPSVEI